MNDDYFLPWFRHDEGDTRWRQQAACADAPKDIFYPRKGDFRTLAAAQQICARCPVVDDCADYAIRTRQRDGIWGGMSGRQLAQRQW